MEYYTATRKNALQSHTTCMDLTNMRKSGRMQTLKNVLYDFIYIKYRNWPKLIYAVRRGIVITLGAERQLLGGV